MDAPCPVDSQLRSFIDERILDRSLVSRIEQHVETCAGCQSKIESWLEQPDLITLSGQSSADDTIERLIKKLESQIPTNVMAETIHSGKMLGGYRLMEVIGHGTTGVVYRAEDSRLGRQVAVKVLRIDFAASDESRARLEREARATASLRQPNIVSVYDVSIDPAGTSYLVMELVDGGTLRNNLRNGSLETRHAAKLAQQLLSGLVAAHEKGLVHRDIKSSNVLIEMNTGIAKLTDFGLVRDLENDSQLTRDNVIAGTPAYMSPEQVLTPHDVDRRADIYSLGVVLYEMLAGELPFRGVERMVLKQVMHDEPRSLRKQNDAISRDLETICLKAMSKNPDARYDSAQLMHDDLGRWLEGRPILARPVGPITRVWNWSRRNAGLAAWIAVSLSLLTMLAIGSTISAITIRTASLETKRQALSATRQRDQSMQTLRKLIFDVNELLEPGDTDLDEVQMKLLTVALEGIEEIDRTGETTSLLDVSAVAAKNRLGNAYYRLDRSKDAGEQYRSALALADKVPNENSQRKMLLEEQLRSYEGLASLAKSGEDADLQTLMMDKAEAVAKQLGELTGEIVEPGYLPEANDYLDTTDVNSMESEFEKATQSVPAHVADVEKATEIADALGWYLLDAEKTDDAERVFQKLLQWIETSKQIESNPRFDRAVKTAHYSGQLGLAQVQSLRGNESEFIELLKNAIDALPHGGPNERFHWSISDLAAASLDDLIAAVDDQDPQTWMAGYYGYASQLADQQIREFPDDWRIENDAYIAKARYVRILSACEQKGQADKVWSQLLASLNKLNMKQMTDKRQRRLQKELDRLKGWGYLWESGL